MKLEIRKIRYEDLPEVEASLLPINKEEIMAMRGVTITELLKKETEMMNQTEILLIDDQIICVGGGMPTTEGFLVWLFGTNKIEKYKRYFAKTISDKIVGLS